VRVGAGGGGIVMFDHLRASVVAALEGVADQLPESPPGTKVEPGVRLDVRSSAVARALTCPAATALDGESPFEDGPGVAGWGASVTVLDRIVSGHLDPGRGRPPQDPASGYRTALKEVERLDWPWPWIDGASRAEKAVTAAEVHRRVAATARVLDPFPPADARFIGTRPSWSFPGRPLRLQGRVDLVLGRRDGTHTIVVGIRGDHGPTTRAQLAYEAVVESLQLRRPPALVLGLLPDAGRRWPVTVDDTLLGEGVAAAAVAARAALGARRRDASGLDRRPGPRCRGCAHGGGCAPGAAWLAGPGRLRHGFLPPAS
jgi:hypothetical protein